MTSHMERKLYRLSGNIYALQPITQSGSQKVGAHTLFPKMGRKYNNGTTSVPVISGNSVRGRLRRVVMEDLCELLDDYRFKDDRVSHTFFGGGTLKSGGGDGMIDAEFRQQIKALLPPIALFAGSIGNQMIPSDMEVKNMVVCCKENAADIPEKYRKDTQLSAYELLDQVFFTRRDDNQNGKRKDDENQAIQMKVDLEVLMIGTAFFHEFIIKHPTPLKIACLHRIINIWDLNPTIGGKASSGFGQLRLEYDERLSDDLYVEYVLSNKEKILKYLDEICNKFTDKPKKKKSTNKKLDEMAAEEEIVDE